MDTSWIELPNDHPAYIDGVVKFIELAKENLIEGRTRCPCKRCKVNKWLTLDEVENHILFKGFFTSYKKWIHHGKGDIFPRMLGVDVGSTVGSTDDQSRVVGRDDVGGLLDAAFGVNVPHSTSDADGEEPKYDDILEEPDLFGQCSFQEPNQPSVDTEEAKYRKLLESANEELYVGCPSLSKLSFILHLFHLKCMFHWSAESFNMLLKLLVDAFPHIREFPLSYYDGKKMIKDLGLGYEKIDACPNNCMLYWGDLSGEEKCHVCNTPRRKVATGKDGGQIEREKADKTREPAKVMRYFPLIPRLKRLYMSTKTAEDMRWHDKDRVKDRKLRHPADGLAWKEFDTSYPDFSSDPRSVRLGLASDGFNPYHLMNTTYSTWPVVLIPYNLPPWLCMKPSSFILSSIIPGKSSPGLDIDVYLQPLLHELKLLWEGVHAFDSYSGQWFRLRAALRCTINDFPAYAMLSGWSTKGYNACPLCTTSTHSYNFSGKICYVGHRKWLPDDHHYRSQSDLFDGTEEYGHAPTTASGTEIMKQQEGINYIYGKTKKPPQKKRKRRQVGTSIDEVGGTYEEDGDTGVPWSKRSIFFDLPYWEHNLLRLNLDVMHIEKNVCDNLLGTLLNMDRKNRDDENARRAIEARRIRSHLWLQPRLNREPYMPPASYTMSTEEKDRFLKVLQKLRVPDGYGSNISRCVSIRDRKLSNLKSHDNHVLMQDILPVSLRASKATKVIDLLSDLSSFFKYLCSTTLDLDELDEVQSKIVLTLCELEKEFLPTFFTVMVHLLVHLVSWVVPFIIDGCIPLKGICPI